ncbi:MAG: PEGA domain-containing protein [bacterium]|nr:PEGA domain-containing protein [bacterium]
MVASAPKPAPAAGDIGLPPPPPPGAETATSSQPAEQTQTTTAPPPEPAPAEVKPAPAPATPAERWVQIRSNPPGATVVADNDDELTCRTPCELPLTRGRHVLRFTLAGHQLTPRIIQVPEIDDVTVDLDSESGTLALTSTPPGASIEVNGERRTEKTPALLKLPAGRYKVRLTLEGHQPIEKDVEVKNQVINNLAIDW